VHGCNNVAVIWISKSDPVNAGYLYSFLVLFRLYGESLFLRIQLFLLFISPFIGIKTGLFSFNYQIKSVAEFQLKFYASP